MKFRKCKHVNKRRHFLGDWVMSIYWCPDCDYVWFQRWTKA